VYVPSFFLADLLSTLIRFGTQGIGQAIVKTLVSKGFNVVISDIEQQKDAAQALIKEISGDAKVVFKALDVTSEDQWKAVGSSQSQSIITGISPDINFHCRQSLLSSLNSDRCTFWSTP
jgi:nucleoside-diphosphate-sugar epimerase